VIVGAGAPASTIYVARRRPVRSRRGGPPLSVRDDLGVGDGDGGLDLVPGGPFASGHAVP
jgi:hypothetical protein